MKKNTKIIGIDLDEVLAELLAGCIKIHEWKLGHCDISWHDTRSYNLDEHYGVSREVVVDFFYKPFSDSYLEELIEPVNGAFEKLQILKNAGHTLYVITARKETIRDQTFRFLDTHYPGLIHDVHFANHFTDSSIPKHEICRQLWIQVMIEDNFDYALWIAQQWIQTFLINKPWNTYREETHANIMRVDSWQEIEI